MFIFFFCADNLKSLSLSEVTNNDIKVEVEDNPIDAAAILQDDTHETTDNQNSDKIRNVDFSVKQRRSKRQKRKLGLFDQLNFVKYKGIAVIFL